MNASKARATTRKAVPKKPIISAEEKAYMATLPPKLRKIHLLCLPLRGKLTKALEMK
jgi:hypothetical protein